MRSIHLYDLDTQLDIRITPHRTLCPPHYSFDIVCRCFWGETLTTGPSEATQSAFSSGSAYATQVLHLGSTSTRVWRIFVLEPSICLAFRTRQSRRRRRFHRVPYPVHHLRISNFAGAFIRTHSQEFCTSPSIRSPSFQARGPSTYLLRVRLPVHLTGPPSPLRNLRNKATSDTLELTAHVGQVHVRPSLACSLSARDVGLSKYLLPSLGDLYA
ncbi:hypothetical protein DENSPDRAFT_617058 [Dentipellis sp. KUC8613]|nr:hypothetical protein DENSPDRAFT_617058 [Dentipellis sp. KUC8613]